MQLFINLSVCYSKQVVKMQIYLNNRAPSIIMNFKKRLLIGMLTGAILAGVPLPFTGKEESPTSVMAAQQTRPVSLDNLIQDSIILAMCDNVGGFAYKIPILASEYFDYKVRSHQVVSGAELTSFVTYDDAKIKKVAETITQQCTTPEGAAEVIMEFVHQHVYDSLVEDAYGRDYVKYPIETIVERSGDCEDLVILGAALMKARNIDVALLEFPDTTGQGFGHLALGVCGNFNGGFYEMDGKKYYYAEATGTEWPFSPATWKIGQLPEEGDFSTAIIHPVE